MVGWCEGWVGEVVEKKLGLWRYYCRILMEKLRRTKVPLPVTVAGFQIQIRTGDLANRKLEYTA